MNLPFTPKAASELDVENPEPGIYVDVPIQQYVATKALSRSDVGKYRKHPAYYGVVKEATEAMIFGSQYHAFLLEPELFETYYHQGPKEKRSKADKEWYADLVEKYSKERIYRPQELELMNEMHEALKKKFIESYALLMSSPIFELTVVFWDPEYEMLFKMRIDSPNFEIGAIVDLKTYTFADFKLPRAVKEYSLEIQREIYIQRYVLDYDIDLQEEIYLRGCRFTPGLEELTRFIGVFQMKSDIYFADYFDLVEFRGKAQIDLQRLLPEMKAFIGAGCKLQETGLRRLTANEFEIY